MFEVGRVGVPEATEIVLFMFQLHNSHDLWKPLKSFHQRVFDSVTEAFGKGQVLVWRDVLIAKENDQMVEQSLPDFSD